MKAHLIRDTIPYDVGGGGGRQCFLLSMMMMIAKDRNILSHYAGCKMHNSHTGNSIYIFIYIKSQCGVALPNAKLDTRIPERASGESLNPIIYFSPRRTLRIDELPPRGLEEWDCDWKSETPTTWRRKGMND